MLALLIAILFAVQSTCYVTFISGYDPNITSWQFGNTGALTYRNSSNGTNNPSWMAWTANRQFVYAVNEISNPGGNVLAFYIDYAFQKLRFINSVPSGGLSPCFISVHRSNQWLFVANYEDGFISILPILRGGAVGEAVYNKNHGVQAHMMITDRSGRFVFVPYKGSDYIGQFVFDSAQGSLVPNPTTPYTKVASGAGPRHMVFHPSELWAFVITELASTVITLSYNPVSGTLTPIFTVSSLPPAFNGSNTGAEILITPSGRFVYASNRGHDSIAIFRVELTGELTPVGWEQADGTLVNPRGVGLDPPGTHLLAASQNLNTVTTFSINQQDGTLRKIVNVPVPNQPSFIGVLPEN